MKPVLHAGRNCSSIHSVEETGLLVDGRDYFLALRQSIQQARYYILLAGWEFDSELALLRGGDSRTKDGEVAFLPLLNQLTEANPDLHVYMLAWDFNILYTLKREFFQARRFNTHTNARVQFRFDKSHPFGGCHHQKFAVIDGCLAFVGGMDLCQGHWDDRRHRTRHRLRLTISKKCYGPRHDVQSYATGAAAANLANLFTRRWQMAGGGPLNLPACTPGTTISFKPTHRLSASEVAISRTMGRTIFPPQRSVSEIRRLYQDAIHGAERLIYIENQYFSSYAVYKALIARMQAPGRSPLSIVIIMARQPEAFIEEIGLGTVQAKYMRSVLRVAARTKHTIGIYNTQGTGTGIRETTYIHSKLLLVDDRFLTVGSANLSNRSMGFDSELNLSWEAGGGKLVDELRAVRVDLLAEHCGLREAADLERLANPDGLVEFLNSLANHRRYRLQHHRIAYKWLSEWVTKWTPHALFIDPRKSHVAERLHLWIRHHRESFVARMVRWLNHCKSQQPFRRRPRTKSSVKPTAERAAPVMQQSGRE